MPRFSGDAGFAPAALAGNFALGEDFACYVHPFSSRSAKFHFAAPGISSISPFPRGGRQPWDNSNWRPACLPRSSEKVSEPRETSARS